MPDPTRLRILYVRSQPLVQYARPDDDGEPVACRPEDERAVAFPVQPLQESLGFETLAKILKDANLPVSLHVLPQAIGEDFTLELSKGYDVVYFVGHGSETTLSFEDPNGVCHDLDAGTLAGAFEDSGAKLAVLTACHSAGQLAAIQQTGVPAVIGMTDAVPQTVASTYTRGLFTALAQGKLLAAAHKLGLKAVRASSTSKPADDKLPILVPADSDIVLLAPGQTGQFELHASVPPANIDLPDKPFVGRNEMMVEVNRALAQHRVVVLEGEGGIGKTALAQHVAIWQAERNKYPGGAAFVTFDPPVSRDLAIDAIGVALLGQDFSRAQGNHLDLLNQHFTTHPGLVVLDNFESVVKDSGILQLISDLSPVARVLITTREQVGMGKTVIVKELDDDFAAMLFAVLAGDAGWDGRGDKETLQAICTELGNMPLAIELVAPQAATLSLTTVLERVRKDLATVASDNPTLPKRQRSIIVSLNLSHDPLPEPARVLFRRLSVFAAGAMGFMFPRVCDVQDWENPVAELVRHRLVRFEGDRYTMLPPVRRYAADKLAATGEKDKYEGRFAMYCGAMAQQIHERMDTKDGAKWLGMAGAESDNLLAAQRWFLEHDQRDEATSMANLLGDPFDRAGAWAARQELYLPFRDYAERHGDKQDLAVTLHELANLAYRQGDLTKARELYNQSLAIEQELSNKSGISKTLHQLAMLHEEQGDYAESHKLYNQSLAIKQELGDRAGIAATMHQLAMLAELQGNYTEARKVYDESLAINRELGDKRGIATTLYQLGILAHLQGDYGEARKLSNQSLDTALELGDKRGIATALHQLANVSYAQGDLTEARKLYDQALTAERELGYKSGIAHTLWGIALTANAQGRPSEARSFYDEAQVAFQELGDRKNLAGVIHQLAILAQDHGELADAHRLYDQSLVIKLELGDKPGIALTLGQLGRLAEAEKDDRLAMKCYLRALAIFEELKSPNRDLAKQNIARMRQRLGDEAFQKLYDEVVAELKKPTADS